MGQKNSVTQHSSAGCCCVKSLANWLKISKLKLTSILSLTLFMLKHTIVKIYSILKLYKEKYMSKTINSITYSNTLTIAISDNRGLGIRALTYNRTDTHQATDVSEK